MLDLRPAVTTDARLLWEWANAPTTRANSFSTTPIPWDEHVEWLRQTLADSRRRLLIAMLDGVPVGQIRFDEEGGEAVVSVSVAPSHRGQGLAASLIEQATSVMTCPVRAQVKPSNAPSLRAFAAAGYVVVEETDLVVQLRWEPAGA